MPIPLGVLAAGAGGPKTVFILTSTQSITLTKSFTAYCIGGGGGGGTRRSGGSGYKSGGGGGSGYYATGTVSPGTYTATIGSGGSTSLNSAGGTGGTSSISTVSASGGNGGARGDTSPGTGGSGGSGGGTGGEARGDYGGGANGADGNGASGSGSGVTINDKTDVVAAIGTSTESYGSIGASFYVWNDYCGGPGGVNLFTSPELNNPNYYPDGYGYGGYAGSYYPFDTASRAGGAGGAGVIILVEN